MATANSSSGGANSCPANGGDAPITAPQRLPDGNSIRVAVQDAAERAHYLNTLCNWIHQARSAVDDFYATSKTSPEVAQAMRECGVTYGPEWSNNHEGMGLYWVHRAIGDELDAIVAAVDAFNPLREVAP